MFGYLFCTLVSAEFAHLTLSKTWVSSAKKFNDWPKMWMRTIFLQLKRCRKFSEINWVCLKQWVTWIYCWIPMGKYYVRNVEWHSKTSKTTKAQSYWLFDFKSHFFNNPVQEFMFWFFRFKTRFLFWFIFICHFIKRILARLTCLSCMYNCEFNYNHLTRSGIHIISNVFE